MDSEQTIEAALRVVEATREQGGEARLLGGIGVAVRCPSARHGGPLVREYSDVDLVISLRDGPTLTRALKSLDYAPADHFNALHGRTRMMFDHPQGLHADVFVDEFSMCHRLDFKGRFVPGASTLSLAELLLTKLQVAELNEKDVADAAALLLDHRIGDSEDDIHGGFVTKLLANDWGWWRTVTENLGAIPGHLGRLPLSEPQAGQVTERVRELTELIEHAPKSMRWKMRAKVGDRAAWREEPEETR